MTLTIEDDLKYLGFHLKENLYMKGDWQWLIAKIERNLNTWCNKWLSQGSHLVVIKYFLETIPIYWMYLAWRSKGILDNIFQLYYRFIWERNKEKNGMTLVSWRNLVIPKKQGGWGFKSLFLFSKALE
jgi:hypothetical protein